MKTTLTCCVLILAASAIVNADTIHLLSGKILSGRVNGFTNASFFAELDHHTSTNFPVQMIRTIDFENDSGIKVIETPDQPSRKGRISLYDKGAFSIEDENGEVDRVPWQQIATIIFFATPPPTAPPTPAPVVTAAAPPVPAKKEEPKNESVVRIEQVTDANLDKHVVRGKVTIVDFYADWCGPCKMIGPHLEELTQKNDDVILRKVNIDKNQDLAAKFGITAIPNIIVYDKAGHDLGTIRGANPGGVDELVAKARTSSIN